MNRALYLCAALCTAAGTLLHFAFDRLGRPRWLAPLLAVNESVWEHTKLLTVPVLGLVPLQSRLLGLPAEALMGPTLAALGAGVSAMVLLYYFWVGGIGKNSLWLGVLLFFASTAVCYGTLAFLLNSGGTLWPWEPVLGALVLGYTVFTYAPPRIPLFRDGPTGRYGLE